MCKDQPSRYVALQELLQRHKLACLTGLHIAACLLPNHDQVEVILLALLVMKPQCLARAMCWTLHSNEKQSSNCIWQVQQHQ